MSWTAKSNREGGLRLAHVVDEDGRVVLYVPGSIEPELAMKIATKAAALPDLIEALTDARDWVFMRGEAEDTSSVAAEILQDSEAALKKAGVR